MRADLQMPPRRGVLLAAATASGASGGRVRGPVAAVTTRRRPLPGRTSVREGLPLPDDRRSEELPSISSLDELPCISSLDELADLAARCPDLYVRWSAEVARDLDESSRDELTGVELPGLSASPLAVEDWWVDRPLRLWVARRLYDYHHLGRRKPGARPWLLRGREIGRGPDNEPLVTDVRAVALVSTEVADEARAVIDGLGGAWGSLERTPG